jgi:hypothetical protein
MSHTDNPYAKRRSIPRKPTPKRDKKKPLGDYGTPEPCPYCKEPLGTGDDCQVCADERLRLNAPKPHLSLHALLNMDREGRPRTQ